MLFLREALKNIGSIGAVFPYSQGFVEYFLKEVHVDDTSLVVEVGAGTGAITKQLLKKIKPESLIAIEKHDKFYLHLKKRFPDVTIFHDSLENMAKYIDTYERKANYVVCSIPWSIISSADIKKYLSVISDNLAEGGKLITVMNITSRLLRKGRVLEKMLKANFKTVERSSIYLRNIPPAYYYVAEK